MSYTEALNIEMRTSLPLIWYIHGAGATPHSFSYIRGCLPSHDVENIVYGHDAPLSQTVEALREKAKKLDRPFYIIGHSLGGVVGAAIAAECSNVKRLVTLASPHGGVQLPPWMFMKQLWRDISPSSDVMTALRRSPPTIPTLSIITTSGQSVFGSLFGEPNDGVVSVSSQKSLRNSIQAEIQLNHFEVLLSAEVVTHIMNFIFEGVSIGTESRC